VLLAADMTIRFQYGRFKFTDKGDLRNINIHEDRTESSRLARLAVKTYRMSYKDLKQAGYIDYEQARIKLEPVK